MNAVLCLLPTAHPFKPTCQGLSCLTSSQCTPLPHKLHDRNPSHSGSMNSVSRCCRQDSDTLPSLNQLVPASACRVDDGPVDPAAQSIYIINCLSALEHTLAGHGCCSGISKTLQTQISHQLSALVSAHAGSLLAKSGLAEIADRLR